MSRYKPNFVRGMSGNKLYEGKDLIIDIEGSPLYVLGRLFKIGFLGRRKLIQIEQTGTPNNPQSDKLKFEMTRFSNGLPANMPPGKYRVSCYGYFPGLGGKRWGDNFEVI